MKEIDNETKSILLQIYNAIEKESLAEKGEGWVNLVKFAPAVKKAGIDYKSFGYEKFAEFLHDEGDFYILYDKSISITDKYARLKSSRVGSQQTSDKKARTSVRQSNVEDVERVKTRLRLENNQFIGQFAPSNTEGWYKITDIRNTDFTKIEDKERGINNLSINFPSEEKFNKFAYSAAHYILIGRYLRNLNEQ